MKDENVYGIDMKPGAWALRLITLSILLIVPSVAPAATRYVSPTGSDASSPFTAGWSSAARTIQAAIDVSASNDIILVTNGVFPGVTIRVPIRVESVNGPSYSIIDASNLTRCAWITNGSTIAGFTLMNGVSSNGAGLFLKGGGVASNCVVTRNMTTTNGFGGGAYLSSGGTLILCTISNNASGYDGGGIYMDRGGQAIDCLISDNSATNHAYGGGVLIYGSGVVSRVSVRNNYAFYDGGGIYMDAGGTATNCTIELNRAGGDGAGVYLNGGNALFSTIRNNECVGSFMGYSRGAGAFITSNGLVRGSEIRNNQTRTGGAMTGGGVFLRGAQASVESCAIIGNISGSEGGGVYSAGGMVRSCTVIQNDTILIETYGGGLYCATGTVENSIIYDNYAADLPSNYLLPGPAIATNCASTPLPPGTGSITSTPGFVSIAGDYHLAAGSPCLGKGIARTYTTGKDIDGQLRSSGTTDIGADEYIVATSVTARTTGPYTTWVGSNILFSATNSTGTNLQCRWASGDETAVSDWSNTLTRIASYSATGTFTASVIIRNTTAQSWTNTQVTVLETAPTLAFVPPTYTGLTGTSMTFAVTASYPGSPSFLTRFILGGVTGGWSTALQTTRTFNTPTTLVVTAECQRLTPPPESTPTGPIATASAPVTVYSATLLLSSSSLFGSARPAGTTTQAYGSAVTCSVAGSPASFGANTQFVATGWMATGVTPASGLGTSVVLTVTANTSVAWLWRTNLYLGLQASTGGTITGSTTAWQALDSPISLMATPSAYYGFTNWTGDFTGLATQPVQTFTMTRTRSLRAAFTPQLTPTNPTPLWWLAQNSLPTNSAGAIADTDLDGHANWQEYVADTVPTNPNSVLAATSGGPVTGTTSRIIRWPSSPGRVYDLLWTTQSLAGFTAFATNLPGNGSTISHTDSVHSTQSRGYYRIKARLPSP